MAHSDGNTSPRREAGGAGLEVGGQVTLGVDLAYQGAPAVLGGEQGQAGGDRGLADATLPGDEEKTAVEQSDHLALGALTGGTAAPSGQGAPKPTRRSWVGAPTST